MSEFMPPEPDYTAEEGGENKPDAFDRMAKRNFIASAKNTNHVKWRKEASDDFNFVAGGNYDDSGQWHQDQIDALKAQNRPIITLNRLEPMIEGIVGSEVNNRQEVSFEARETGDKTVAMALMEIGKWARDNDVEEEETDMFRNALICGMGWTKHIMDYSEDMDGKYTVISTDPLGHYWDIDARRPNLTDASWVGCVEVMTKRKFNSLFEGAKGADNIFGQRGLSTEDENRVAKDNSDYDDPNLRDTGDRSNPSQIHVLEYQCFKMEPAYRVLDPETGELSPPLDKKAFKKIKKAAAGRGAVMIRFGTPEPEPEAGEAAPTMVFRYVLQERRVYYRAFYSGDKRLEEKERSPWRRGFNFQCVTARRHHIRNTFYGVVRAMKDPQRYTNSFMSASIHHYNSNPKGGMGYEEGAVENEGELQANLAAPSPLVKFAPGGLQKKEWIQPAQSSQALDKMIQIVGDLPPLVTGISLESLGLASRDQPVGLEQTRKLATLSIVSPIFSSYRKYRKTSGRLLFDYCKDYIPSSTMKRVLSAESQVAIPLLKKADTLQYDIHVDDAPLSPSVKSTVFSAMKDFAQFMFGELPPQARLLAAQAFFEYSPLPAGLVKKLNEAMVKSQEPDPMAKQFQDAEYQKLLAEGYNEWMDGQLKSAKATTEAGKETLEREKLDVSQMDSFVNFMQTKMQTQARQNKPSGGAQ